MASSLDSEAAVLRDRTEGVANQLRNEVLVAQDAAIHAVHAAERDVTRAAAKRDANVKYETEEEEEEEAGSVMTEEEEELKRAVRRRTECVCVCERDQYTRCGCEIN